MTLLIEVVSLCGFLCGGKILLKEAEISRHGAFEANITATMSRGPTWVAYRGANGRSQRRRGRSAACPPAAASLRAMVVDVGWKPAFSRGDIGCSESAARRPALLAQFTLGATSEAGVSARRTRLGTGRFEGFPPVDIKNVIGRVRPEVGRVPLAATRRECQPFDLRLPPGAPPAAGQRVTGHPLSRSDRAKADQAAKIVAAHLCRR